MEVDVTKEKSGLKRSESEIESLSASVPQSLPVKEPAPWFKRRRLLAVVSLVAVAAALSVIWISKLSGTSHESPVATAPPPVVAVSVAPVQLHTIAGSITVNGSIWPWDPLNIGAEINGLRIDKIFVEEGDIVKRGQILARLNSSVLEAQLAQEKARLKASRASLKKAIQPNRLEDISSLRAANAQTEANVAEQEANLTKEKANLIMAKNNATRYRSLASEGAVSDQEVEMRETQAQTAEAEVRNLEQRVRAARFLNEQAKQKLLMAERGGRREDVEISEASVAETEANVKRLEATIEQTVIRAPTDGLIMRRDAHLGDITAMNKNLFMMARDNRLELRAQVPEVELNGVHPGQKVTITDQKAHDKLIVGTVREVSPMVDQDLRLGTVRIDLPVDSVRSERRFLPGNFVHGVIALEQRSVLAVPLAAVATANDASFVFVLNQDNSVTSRKIQTGTRKDGLVEVLSGLNAGEEIVVRGAGFLKNGDFVKAKRGERALK